MSLVRAAGDALRTVSWGDRTAEGNAIRPERVGSAPDLSWFSPERVFTGIPLTPGDRQSSSEVAELQRQLYNVGKGPHGQ